MRPRKVLALGLGVTSILLASTLLLAPGLRDRIREEWHMNRLGSEDLETRSYSAWVLLEARSERFIVRLLKEPRPENHFQWMWIYFGNYPLQPACRLIQEIGPRSLARICTEALARGHLTEAEILGFCNRSIPGWAEAMKALRRGDPPRELRSLADLPEFIDRVQWFLEEVY